jgi:hypothetical protein
LRFAADDVRWPYPLELELRRPKRAPFRWPLIVNR